MSFEFNNSIITKRRKGDVSDPFISISEAHTITNSTVQLSEIPDEFTKVTVSGNDVTWLEQSSGIPSANTYVVDYDINLVTFHATRNGLQLQFNFKGTGMHFIPALMVYTQLDENNTNVIQTLQEVADSANNASTLISNLESNISTGTALNSNLTSINTTANITKANLDQSISNGIVITQNNLRNLRYRKIMGVNY